MGDSGNFFNLLFCSFKGYVMNGNNIRTKQGKSCIISPRGQSWMSTVPKFGLKTQEIFVCSLKMYVPYITTLLFLF